LSDLKVHVLNKMLWPFTASARTRCMPFLAPISSDGEGVTHSLDRAGAIRAKLICVVRACTRVTYSRAGFGQKLLA